MSRTTCELNKKVERLARLLGFDGRYDVSEVLDRAVERLTELQNEVTPRRGQSVCRLTSSSNK